MGILDELLNLAEQVLHEIGKDKPSDIRAWIAERQSYGAIQVDLKRKRAKGGYIVVANAVDAYGGYAQETWHIECNTGFKKFWEGDQSGLYNLFEAEDGKEVNEITYYLNSDNDDYNDDKYFISKDYKQTGPFNSDQLKMMLLNGIISNDYFASLEGSSSWVPISNIINLNNQEVYSNEDEEDVDEDYEEEDDFDEEDEEEEDDFDEEDEEEEDDFDDEE